MYKQQQLCASSWQFAGEVKRHNPVIGSEHTTYSQWDDGLFGTKTHALHKRITLPLPQ